MSTRNAMKFFNFAKPVWWLLLLGVIVAIFAPMIPLIRPTAAYALAILLLGFGVLALWAFWVDWNREQKRRNSYNIEPFKVRLEKYHQRRRHLSKYRG